jgi:hypothetical protein
MAIIELQGRITEEGRLEVELPVGLPAGEARITIETSPTAGWSAQELAEALKIEPLTGAEMIAAGLTGGWKADGIPDGAEWVERQRHGRHERRR